MYASRRDLGGGVVLSQIHELDVLYWFFGRPRRIVSMGGHLSDLEIDVEDTATLLLSFDSGAVGVVHLNMIERPALRRCRIAGALGTLTWDAGSHNVRQFCAARDSWSDLYTGSDLDYSDAYLAEMKRFLDCVEGGAPVAVTGEDALRTLEIIDAAKRSALEGRTVMI